MVVCLKDTFQIKFIVFCLRSHFVSRDLQGYRQSEVVCHDCRVGSAYLSTRTVKNDKNRHQSRTDEKHFEDICDKMSFKTTSFNIKHINKCILVGLRCFLFF